MKLKVKEIRKNIFHIVFPNQHLVSSTMFRLQEFYESPIKKVQGKYVSLEQIIDLYANEYKYFTYFQDWNGFNIPDNVIKKFFELYNGKLLSKECQLKRAIQHKILDNPEKTYLIATHDNKTIPHEIAHGFWYLYEQYRTNMTKIIQNYSHKNMVFRALKKMGYPSKVHYDELQAYLSTDTSIKCRTLMFLPKNWKYTSSFSRIYKSFNKHLLI